MSDTSRGLRAKRIIIVTVSIMLILGSLLVILYPKPRTKIVEESTKEIDNRISPLTNQGLVVEVKRIRHRGLLEKLLKFGSREWKEKPKFYVIVEIDGLVFSSKNVTMLGSETDYLYNTWDTWDSGFEEFKIVRDVEEEQLKSKVTITIMERVNYGLFGRKTKDIEKEKIQLTYDYRTGRWSGDDYAYDSDGYGHYLGDNFEIWFNIYQTDFDGDGIPYWTEVNVLHTDPYKDDSKLDPDRDGVPTSWEWKWGYDPFTWDDHRHLDPDIDGLENIEEYKMEKWLANPYTPDIYIEVDVMEKGSFFDINRQLYEETKQALIERFSEHGINLYIDDGWPNTPRKGGGEKLPFQKAFSQDTGMILRFYDTHFPDERKGIFRYVVLGCSGSFCHPAKFNRYDAIHLGVSRRGFVEYLSFTPRAVRVTEATTLMHELGHSCGITPWSIEGCDNISFFEGKASKKKYEETWANYKSVMNYYWLWYWQGSLSRKEIIRHTFLDYSDGSRGPPYDQNDWEHLYLPTFQIDASVIEEPYFEPPGTDKIVDKNVSPYPGEGWVLVDDRNLTATEEFKTAYINKLSKSSPLARGFEWRVYRKVDAKPGERNIKIYAKPKVEPTFAVWSLVAEGYIGEEGIHFYSLEKSIEEILT